MADSVISQLPPALSITAADFIPIDQGGVTKRATLGMLGNGTVFVVAGKIFTVNNTLTLAGTDGTTMTFPSTNASLARTDAAQSFTGLQTFTNGITTPAQVTSTVATGTPPLVVASTTPVTNLSIGGNAATVTTNANLTGEVTSVGNATTVTNAAVIGKVLTGFVSGAGTVAATDTILQAVDKLDGNVAARALLAGSASQTFSVAQATASTMAPQFGQVVSADNPFANGAMMIDQANAGAVTTINAATVFYPMDTIIGLGTAAAGVFTVQQLNDGTGPAGFPYYMRIKTTTADAAPAAGSIYTVDIRSEGFDWSRFSFGTSIAKTITLPYLVRSSITGTFSGSLRNGAVNRSYPFTYTINTANVWQQISLTVVGDTTGTWDKSNGLGFIFTFDIGSGSTSQGTAGVWAAASYLAATGATKLISTLNATLDITGIDAVEGMVARQFPFQNEQMTLARCQRYYRLIGSGMSGVVEGTTFVAVGTTFSSPMRTTPSASQLSTTPIIRANGTNITASGSTLVVVSVDKSGVVLLSGGFAGLTAGQASVMQTADVYAISARL